MRRLLNKLKPGGSVAAHLFLAAMLWSVVGILLMVRGSTWLFEINKGWLFFPGILVGGLKALLILDKTAGKSIDRIHHLNDGACLGAVYSWKTWGLVVFMMFFGYLLRNISFISHELVGFIYVAIGWALFLSSRKAWQAWKEKRRDSV